MSRAVTVLVPAAGRSSRYEQAGITTPKGLIRFRWRQGYKRPMIAHVALNDHHLSDRAEFYVGVERATAEWCALHEFGMNLLQTGPTRGQAETVLRMLQMLDLNAAPVLVLNTDAGFTYPLDLFVRQSLDFPASALVFHSRNRAYSYVDGMPTFHTAREKDPITKWAMAGAYFFPRGEILREAIELQISANHVHNGEFYLSGAFTYMLGMAKLAVPMQPSQWHSWGTPEDLAHDAAVEVEDPAIEAILKTLR